MSINIDLEGVSINVNRECDSDHYQEGVTRSSVYLQASHLEGTPHARQCCLGPLPETMDRLVEPVVEHFAYLRGGIGGG